MEGDLIRPSVTFMNIYLILEPLLNGAATFFWTADTQGATAGALSGLSVGFWLLGLLRIYRHMPYRHVRFLVPMTVFGTVGGVAFSVQAIHEEMFGASHAATLELLIAHPLAANTLFWICGPLFPITLAALGVLLWRGRAVPVPVAVLILIGAVAFPLSRASREITIAHVADLVLLLPFLWVGLRDVRDAREPEQPAAQAGR